MRQQARFINVGERTNVTGSARFKKLIFDGEYEKALMLRVSKSKVARRLSTSTWMKPCSTAKPPWCVT